MRSSGEQMKVYEGPDDPFRVRRRDDRARSTDELAALTRIAAAAADAYRLEDVMEQAAEATLEVTGAASLSISKWERDDDAIRTLINVGQLGPSEERFPADERYALAAYPAVAGLLREARPYVTAVDDPDAPQSAVELLRSHGKESELAVPIFLDGEVWGEVWATTAAGSRRFDGGDIRFLQAIADRLALVLARAERYSRVSRLAYEDPLTGLANRRAVEERLELLLDPHAPTRVRLTLLICDVDGLKDINDVHGHYIGDRALCRVADALVAAAAPVSAALVGRLAGDEFCVLLEGCDPAAASDVAAVVLSTLAAEDELPLSVSFGAAAAVAGTTASGLLRAADGAQYAAKRRGGGRLCTADAATLSEAVAGDPQPSARGLEQRLERTAAELMGILDADLATSPALDRMEAVAGAVGGALNAAAWAISSWDRGSAVLRTVSTADDRASRLRGERVGLEEWVYELTDYPQTAALLASGHGGFLVTAADPSVDPAELALVREMGYREALAVAARVGDRTYLLELYADARTAELSPAAIRTQLLLRVAAAVSTAS
jgi:diguanylate cyclase (GGDEF)-like protein